MGVFVKFINFFQLHATSAGLKAFTTTEASAGIEVQFVYNYIDMIHGHAYNYIFTSCCNL